MSREEGQQLARMEAELARAKEAAVGFMAERDALEEENRRLREDLVDATVQEVRKELARLREEVADADEDRKSDQAELARLRESRSALEASNVDLIIERDRLREDQGRNHKEIFDLEDELARLRVYETLYKKEVEENTRLREALEKIATADKGANFLSMNPADIARNALKETK